MVGVTIIDTFSFLNESNSQEYFGPVGVSKNVAGRYSPLFKEILFGGEDKSSFYSAIRGVQIAIVNKKNKILLFFLFIDLLGSTKSSIVTLIRPISDFGHLLFSYWAEQKHSLRNCKTKKQSLS